MTEKLHRALVETAEHAPVFDVYDRALADGRRRRRTRLVVASASAVAVALLAIVLPHSLASPDRQGWSPAAPPGTSSLPDRLSRPQLWTPTVGQSPAGPAAVLTSQRGLWPVTGETQVAVIGATANSYRTLDVDGRMRLGADGMLSPAGDRFVTGDGVKDLLTGRSTALAGANATTRFTPLGWSPDADTLAVIRTVEPAARQPSSLPGATVGLLDLGSGDFRPLVDVTQRAAGYVGIAPGHMVAFSPDSVRVAVQVGSEVMIFDRAGTRRSSFRLPPDSQLAGKGAFTSDGTTLAVVTRAACCSTYSDPDLFPSSWRVRLLDPATGAERTSPALPSVPYVTALRVLGWWPSGEAIVAAYHPRPGTSAAFDPSKADPDTDTWGYSTDYEHVDRVDVRALEPGGQQRTLVGTPPGTDSIDVADQVIAGGSTRTGAVAPLWPVRTGWMVVAALLVAPIGWLVVRRLLRWRRRTAPTFSAANR